MNQTNIKSQKVFKNPEQQQFNQFYMLHYSPNKKLQEPTLGFGVWRSKSMVANNAIIMDDQSNSDFLQKQKSKEIHKKIKERIKQKHKSKDKQVTQKRKNQKISFHNVLSKEMRKEEVSEYFTKYAHKSSKTQLDEYCKKSIGVRLAVQKCKDQKLKIQKVITSVKQSQETKLDYLQLKKRDVEDEISKEIKTIYQEFFKKQYQETFGPKAFQQFQEKMKMTIDILHQQMFEGK